MNSFKRIPSNVYKVVVWLTIVIVLIMLNVNYFFKEFVWSTKCIEPYAFVNKAEYIVNATEEGLSIEQKVSDFLYMTEILKESYPLNDIDEEIFGFQIEEKNEEFLNLIKESKNDMEFYCILWKYFSTVNSAHSGLPFPSLERYEHNRAKASEGYEGIEVGEYATYWKNVFKTYATKYSEEDKVSFRYAEGEYYLNGSENDYIVEMNGMVVEQYLTEFPMANRRYYDFIQDKFYYDHLVFHAKAGVPVQIKMASGKSLSVYYDEIYECYCHNVLRLAEKEDVPKREIYSYLSDNGEIAYLHLGSFEWDYYLDIKEQLENITREQGGVDFLLIDLRNNSGGIRRPMAELIISYLVEERIKAKSIYYIPYTEQNAKWEGYSGALTKKVPKVLENGKWFFVGEETFKVNGDSDFSGEIFVLIDSYTCSAADYIAAVLKDNDLGVLVGENTSGEGLGSTAYSFVLPNSGLMIEYMAGHGVNSDGTLNSRYGTSPDYYVERTISDINCRENESVFETWDVLLENDSQIQYIYENFILKD